MSTPRKPDDAKKKPKNPSALPPGSADPDWTKECENCGDKPIVPVTGLCGPCTFGESKTAGGNW